MHEASRRILSVLLQKVEGFSSAKKTTVICATNRYNLMAVLLYTFCQSADTITDNRKQDLDSALISRFDLCIRYDLPDEDTRKAVLGRCVVRAKSHENGGDIVTSAYALYFQIREAAFLRRFIPARSDFCGTVVSRHQGGKITCFASTSPAITSSGFSGVPLLADL